MKKNKLFIVILAIVFIGFKSLTAQPYNIYTVAGNGVSGYSGDGGAATAAKLTLPAGVATDASGNVYVCDLWNNRIREVNTSGIISTFAGNGTGSYSGDGGPATAATLSSPYGVAVDASGNIYIADYNNNRIRKVNTSGIISTFAGNGTAGYSGDGGAATAATISSPFDVAVDASGNVYFSDTGNDVIRKVNTSGIISTIAGNGTTGFSGDGGLATAAELNFPRGVAVDASGNVYIADASNNRIRKVNTSGIISTIAGNGGGGFSGDGGLATAAALNGPAGVAVDASGHIYISDANNYRVRELKSTTALPIELLYFKALLIDENQVLCKWATATEINNDYFTVEKTQDGVNYQFVAKVKGAGNSTTTLNYSIIDPAPYSGTSYYRLKQTDFDGNYVYSNLEPVNVPTIALITIYPNPSSGYVQFSIGSNEDGMVQIQVIDVLGRILLNKQQMIAKGITQNRLDVSTFASGTYLLKITNGKLEETEKQFLVK